MVDSTGLIALGVAGAGGLLAYQTLGSGSQNNETSSGIRGGFTGLPAVSRGTGFGIPDSPRRETTTVTKKVDYSPSSENTTYNVNTQPRAGASDTQKKTKKYTSGSSSSSSGSSGSDSSSSGSIDLSKVEPDNKLSKKTMELIEKTTPSPEDSPAEATKKLNMGKGYTRSRSTSEMTNEELGIGTDSSSKKEDKSSGGGFIDNTRDSIGNFFNDTIGWGDIN